MSSMTTSGRLTLLSLAAAFGCGGDLALPEPSGEGVALSIEDGNDQTGQVGEELPRPLVVRVESGGARVPGHVIAFSIVAAPPGVEVEPDTARTGEDGLATAHVMLGRTTGTYQIEAKLVAAELPTPPSAVFVGAAVAGEPDTLRAASPTTQPGRRGEQAEDSPTVVVLDRFGNPVAGAAVEWTVTAGGGAVSGGETADGDGRASATWTLGSSAGVQKLVARVEGAHGSPITFFTVVLF